MRSLGYVDGNDHVLEVRFGRGDPERTLAFATELVGLKVDVIITQGSEAARAAKQATKSIPIVFAGPSYPIEEGFVTSFARPGGNITGITVAMSDTVSKHLQLLRDTVPKLADVAMIWSPANPGNTLAFRDTKSAAASLRLKVHSVPMGSEEGREHALPMIARLQPGALIVQPSAFAWSRQCVADRRPRCGTADSIDHHQQAVSGARPAHGLRCGHPRHPASSTRLRGPHLQGVPNLRIFPSSGRRDSSSSSTSRLPRRSA